jgi:cytochrome c biogenesis protein CcmG, thiol:disulfide interchange protein DsbE
VLGGIALVVLLVIAGITWWSVRDDEGSSTASPDAASSLIPSLDNPDLAKVGDVAPDFALTTLDGDMLRLSDLRGTPVVLNFWASFCNPCRREFPALGTAERESNGEYAIVGVNTRDIRSDAKGFAKEEHATWPNGFDGDRAVAKAYGVAQIPQTFFIRADGTIAARTFAELDTQAIQRGIAKAS